ncbi:DUF3859 domain-containing protein [Ancylomarina sp. DW003]|nr:DUF3859 domain-containing protein [Ancylomarina sp. DW003]MDE5421527.1 DUF3859 domain-containing protein [Ancylomarina sp. DW003]
MRYEEYEAIHTISYNPEDINSMREALKQYGDLVKSGEAFRDDYCVAHFNPDLEIISTSFFNDHPHIIEYLKGTTYYSADRGEENLQESTLTETLLFACAIRHPELEMDIKEACEAIVAYARRLNDSSEMWLTCEMPFGIEALQLTASIYPKYGYLLAGFLVPYWDDEHMPDALYYLAQWSNKLGITEDTIKAFCYCDNSRARENMLGYDSWDGMDSDQNIDSSFNLIIHFKENADALDLFKAQLAERFQHQDLLGETPYNPIEGMVLDIMMLAYPYDTWDDDFDKDDYLTQTFIHKSAEEEIEEITQDVKNLLGRDIIPPKKKNKQRTEKKVEAPERSLKKWQLFIEGAFTNGKHIWEYITEGEHKELVAELEYTNFYKLARLGKYAVYEEIDAHAYSFDDIHEELHDILKKPFNEIKDKQILSEFCSKSNLDSEAVIFRFLDVIFKCCGSVPFHEDFIEFLDKKHQLYSKEAFNKRYVIEWQPQLDFLMKKFSGYRSEVNIQQLEDCLSVIKQNRTEACDSLPNTLWHIETQKELDANNEDVDYLERKSQLSKIEKLCLAAFLLTRDIKENKQDKLTLSAKAYLEAYAVSEFLDDLYKGTEFPDSDEMNLLNTNPPAYYDEEHIEKCRQAHRANLIFDTYIREGGTIDKAQHSQHTDMEVATNLLSEYLKYEDDEISEKQRQLEWLGNYEDKTQKLLLVAHLIAQMENLSCVDSFKRLLTIAFALAPVKITHLLSKYYERERYDFDNHLSMLDMLDVLKEQGLSDEGYWAFQMGYYCGRNDLDELSYYKNLLIERIKPRRKLANEFLYSTYKTQQRALVKAVELLPRSNQLAIIKDTRQVEPDYQITGVCMGMFIDKIARKLRKGHQINNIGEYVKSKLKFENIAFQEVERDRWNEHSELVKQIFTQIKVSKPEGVTQDNYEKQLEDIKGWNYIVLQKTGAGFELVYGEKILWLIQNGFNEENIDETRTAAIILDETCPQQHIAELKRLDKTNYREEWVQRILHFLMGMSKINDVEDILRHGINSYDFSRSGNYYDVSISDLILNLDTERQVYVFQMLGLIDHTALDLYLDMDSKAYFDLLMRYNVDRYSIFKYLSGREEDRNIRHLSRKIDISPFILKEKIERQVSILNVIAHMPQYHPFIISLEKAKSKKLREEAKSLIQIYFIKSIRAIPFHIVDYGLYIMESVADGQGSGASKIAHQPKCINQTTSFKAEKGLFFGFRFTADYPDKAPKVTVHRVKVRLPQRDEGGAIKEVESSWEQNGYCNSNIFTGWHFETEEELLAGIYRIAVYDTDENLLVEKGFEIE